MVILHSTCSYQQKEVNRITRIECYRKSAALAQREQNQKGSAHVNKRGKSRQESRMRTEQL